MKNNVFGGVGCALMFLGIAAGAFGAHGLKDFLDPAGLKLFETATLYCFVHALALFITGLPGLLTLVSVKKLRITQFSFLAGTVLFSGSLYLLALTQIRAFGAITPIGGVLFLVGWANLGIALLKRTAP